VPSIDALRDTLSRVRKIIRLGIAILLELLRVTVLADDAKARARSRLPDLISFVSDQTVVSTGIAGLDPLYIMLPRVRCRRAQTLQLAQRCASKPLRHTCTVVRTAASPGPQCTPHNVTVSRESVFRGRGGGTPRSVRNEYSTSAAPPDALFAELNGLPRRFVWWRKAVLACIGIVGFGYMNQDKLAEELPNLPGRLEDAIAAMLTAAQQRPDDHRFLASRALAADKNVSDTPPAVFHQALLSALESRLRNRPTQPLVLFGPSGAGKSWLAEHAARRADASCIMIRLGGATTAAELVGQVQLAVGDDAELLLGVKARVSADNAPILLASALSSLRRRLLALASLETDLRPVVIIDDACFRTAAAEASEEAAARRDSLLAQLGGWARHGFCHVIVTCIDPRFVTEARAGTALGRCASLCVCEMGDSEAVACMRAVYGARGITLDVEQARRVLDRVGRLPADLVSLWDDTLAATTAADVASHAEAESARLRRSLERELAPLRPWHRTGWLSSSWGHVTQLLSDQARRVAWEAVQSDGKIRALLDAGVLTTDGDGMVRALPKFVNAYCGAQPHESKPGAPAALTATPS